MMATGGLRSARTISALPSLAPDTGDARVEAREAVRAGGTVVRPAIASGATGERQQRGPGVAVVFNSQPRNGLCFLTASSTESTKLTRPELAILFYF